MFQRLRRAAVPPALLLAVATATLFPYLTDARSFVPSFGFVAPSPPATAAAKIRHPRPALSRTLFAKPRGFAPISDDDDTPSHAQSSRHGASDDDSDPLASIPDDRKANLFQALLRDLQIEGVPLLECDVSEAQTLSAAAWTTMAELSDADEGMRVCMVAEDVGVDALRELVKSFEDAKDEEALVDALPEVRRMGLSLVGRGVGPAFVIESQNRTDEEIVQRADMMAAESSTDEEECAAVMQCAVESDAGTQGPIAFRHSASSDVCSVMGTFWICLCELQSVPSAELTSVVLSIPAFGGSLERFNAMARLMGQSLILLKGDNDEAMYDLACYHPAYAGGSDPNEDVATRQNGSHAAVRIARTRQ